MKLNVLSRVLMPVLLLLLFSQLLFAQEKKISGSVNDLSTGKALSGVNVQVKGSSKGVTTDAEGKFVVTVDGTGAVLTVSYVGYTTLEVKAGNGLSPLVIQLTAEDKKLDEVVVIGYGTVKRRDLTGSVASVKAGDITRSPTSNPLEAIQGMVPGMDITKTSGKAGQNVNIQLRGNRSVSGGSDPLYIIDGAQGGSVNTLNPNDIESIEILKDASSTAIYGSQGANGVIIVTTKKGSNGKAKIAYNGYLGIDGWAEYPRSLTGDGFIKLRREAYRTAGLWSSPADDAVIFNDAEKAAMQQNKWIDWVGLVLQNGIRQSHSVSVSGGTDKTKAYFSGGIYTQNGLMKENNMKQYNALMNLDQTVNTAIKAGMQTSFVYSDINTRSSDPLSLATTSSPLGNVYDSAGNINKYPLNVGSISPLSDDRGKSIATNNQIQTKIGLNAHADVQITKKLSFRTLFGAQLVQSRTGKFFDSTALETVNTKKSVVTVNNTTSKFYNWDNVLTYNNQFGDHSITVTALATYTNRNTEVTEVTGYNAIYSPQLFYNLGGTSATDRVISSSYVQAATMSYAGRINYSYKGRYLLTVTSRTDAASVLAEHHKWQTFPSVAAGWRISDERFMQNAHAVTNLKLRASYGISGNAAIQAYSTQGTLVSQPMSFSNISAPGYVFSSILGNDGLTWERSKTMNLGVDLGLWQNKVNATIDVYNTNTYDILLLRSLPPDLGITSSYQNIGKSRNRGIELGLTTRNITNKNFTWTTSFNFTAASEKITGLINGKNIIDASNPETASLLMGHPVNSFYTYKKLGIWQTNEATKAAQMSYSGTPYQPGDIKVADLNHDNKISLDSDRAYIGSKVPKWSLGLQNTFTYHNFDLNIQIIARWGQMIKADFLGRYNPAGEGNNSIAYLDYWTPENPSNDYPRPKKGASITSYPGYNALNYVDGSYVKLKNVSLGYTLSPNVVNRLKISSLRFYATCNNIYTVTKSHLIKYYDPEAGGAEAGPLTRQLVFGVNLGL